MLEDDISLLLAKVNGDTLVVTALPLLLARLEDDTFVVTASIEV